MANLRKKLIDPDSPAFYHLVSRCVCAAFLTGCDPFTGEDYSHREQWLIHRLNLLTPHFAVELHGYTIRPQEFHLILFHDPKAYLGWSKEEVAERWLAVSPPRTTAGKSPTPDRIADARRRLLEDPERLAYVAEQLGSMSTYMKLLKQGIALRANLESGAAGHFFVQRFWSKLLSSEEAVLEALASIEFNPVRAEIARTTRAMQSAGVISAH
jgi:hypothetical protein